MLHLSYLYNPDVDGPQSANYLCCSFTSESQHLGVIQLSIKDGRFTDQDVLLLDSIACQLSGIIAQLHSTQFLNQVSSCQF